MEFPEVEWITCGERCSPPSSARRRGADCKLRAGSWIDQETWLRKDLRFVALILGVVSCASLSVGCSRAPEARYTESDQAQALPETLRDEVRSILRDRCGDVKEPRMLGDAAYTPAYLHHGANVYARRCLSCHGVSGDGKGPASPTLIPKPRDYRQGIFKFTTTPYDRRPRRDDLARTIRRGVPGTSMPSFHLLPDKDLEAVVDYVIVLAKRGEFESALAREAADYWDDAVDDVQEEQKSNDPAEIVKVFRKSFGSFASEERVKIVQRWERAEKETVDPLTPQPELTAERARLGREFFLNTSTGCNKCHGDDGRGQTPENLRGDLKDRWGHRTQAADLTSGMLRGGSEPVDIYRRIHSGISGTPMPGFAEIFAKDPDQIWNVVAFVLYISNERRRGVIPEAAIGPMPGASESASTNGPGARP